MQLLLLDDSSSSLNASELSEGDVTHECCDLLSGKGNDLDLQITSCVCVCVLV